MKMSGRMLSMVFAAGVAVVHVPCSSFAADNAPGAEEEFFLGETPVVITASKKAERIQEAPAVVTVITAQEIKDFGAVSLYDVVQRMPSVQPVGTHLYPRNTAVVRGDLVGPYDNHILILINGRPFRDDVSGGLNAAFYNIFPIEVIDRIEFVRGPGSVLYGTDAFDGVINVITRKAAKDVEAEATAGLGSFGATIGKATVGCKKGDLDLIVNGNYFKDDGWDFKAISYFPATASSMAGSTKYANDNISGSVFLKYKDFTFNSFIARLKQVNFGLTPVWQISGVNGQSWLTTDRRFADIGYSKKLSDDYHLQANVTYNYYLFKSYALSSLASSEGAYDVLGEVSLSGSVTKDIGFIVGGVFTNLRNESPDKAKIPDFNRNYYSGYTQLDYKPLERLKLVGGVQYNKPDDIDGVTVPRIGGVYQLTDSVAAKVSYAEAFRSPWPVETLTNYPGVLVGNPLLAPEKVKTTDAQLLLNTPKNHSSLTVFNNSYDNLVTRVAHPTVPATSSYANIGTLNIRGVELESKVSITSGLYVEGSGTYQHEVDNKVLTPDYMVKAGVSYHTGFGLNAGVFDNYFGEPKKNAGVVLNPEAKAIHLVSVNLNYTIPAVKSMEVALFVQNALDQEYNYPEFSKNWVNTLPLEPGRAVYGTVTYKF